MTYKCPRCGHTEIHPPEGDFACSICSAPSQLINHEQTPAEEMLCRYECGEKVSSSGEICNICEFSSRETCKDCHQFNLYKDFRIKKANHP